MERFMERLAAVAKAGRMMIAGLAGLAIATTLAASLPTAAHASELSAAYSQLLRDPDNVELNMRYARIAERQGKIRKAMAAYERVLQIDPGHREASVALGRITVSLIPVSTRGRVEVGGRYESNPRELPPGFGFSQDDDISFFAKLRVNDRRPLFGHDWRSVLSGYFDVHDDRDEIDFWRARGYTGPNFDLGDGTGLHIAPGVGLAFLDGDFFYVEPGLKLTFTDLFGGALDRLMVRGAFRDIDNRYRSDDGFLLDVIAHNTWRGILNAADAFLLQPHFKLREASGTGMAGGGPANFLDGDYIQFGGRAAYFYLIAEDIRIGAEFAAHYREYEQSIRLGTAERHDWFIAPAAETLFRNVVCSGCDIRLRYRFEKNYSNDGTEDYTNHSVTASAVRRF